MDVRFSVRDDGLVDADLGPDWPIFNEALWDSISSLPPRGSSDVGPSTYWIDHASEGARRAAATGSDAPFTSGNITLLRVRGDSVVACYDFAEEEEELLPLADFLRLLDLWRAEVLAIPQARRIRYPETYRRNPWTPIAAPDGDAAG